MNKAVESVLEVVAALGLYTGLPVLMIWGWVRWFSRTEIPKLQNAIWRVRSPYDTAARIELVILQPVIHPADPLGLRDSRHPGSDLCNRTAPFGDGESEAV